MPDPTQYIFCTQLYSQDELAHVFLLLGINAVNVLAVANIAHVNKDITWRKLFIGDGGHCLIETVHFCELLVQYVAFLGTISNYKMYTSV